jgi:hypothetical protein
MLREFRRQREERRAEAKAVLEQANDFPHGVEDAPVRSEADLTLAEWTICHKYSYLCGLTTKAKLRRMPPKNAAEMLRLRESLERTARARGIPDSAFRKFRPRNVFGMVDLPQCPSVARDHPDFDRLMEDELARCEARPRPRQPDEERAPAGGAAGAFDELESVLARSIEQAKR